MCWNLDKLIYLIICNEFPTFLWNKMWHFWEKSINNHFKQPCACNRNCMAPLSSFCPSIWRPWRFLHWSPCLPLKLHGAPLVLFSVNLVPLTFSSLEPLLEIETAWRPSRYIDLPFVLSFLFPLSFFSLLFLFFLLSPLSLSFPFLFFFLFGAPLVTPGARAPKAPPPPQDTPLKVNVWCLVFQNFCKL